MIIKTKKIKSNPLDYGLIKKRLSIQFSLDGFSFCVFNQENNELLAFSKYIFDHHINTPEKLLKAIQQIFLKDPELQYSFASVLALHNNELITFVPNAFFDKNQLNTYLKYNNKTLATDFYMYDSIKNQEMKSVYIPYMNVNNYLIDKFGAFEYRHASSVLVEQLLENYAKKETQVFVEFSETFFKLTITRNRELLLFNTFDFQTKEDVLYYLLFAAEQLEIEPSQENLIVLGEITKNKDILTYIKNYFKTIDYIQPKKPISSHKIDKLLMIGDFTLFNQ